MPTSLDRTPPLDGDGAIMPHADRRRATSSPNVTDDFAAVDAGDTQRLVAMMHATDVWPAVAARRAWLLDHTAVTAGAVVVDVGSGPGTFGALAAERGATAVDLDASTAMLDAARRRRPGRAAVCADVARLPMAADVAHLVRAERVLQWTARPDAGLHELARVTAPGGWLAVTDTDWTTFRLVHDEPETAARWAAAALGWVPNARLAATLLARLRALGCTEASEHRDTVTITAWHPDDALHADGPPGLPLRSIATGASGTARVRLDADVAVLADRARTGRFVAALTLVTVVARPPRTGPSR
jgi:SAM-dependent methyltransferase